MRKRFLVAGLLFGAISLVAFVPTVLATATVTNVPNPDAYVCNQPGFIGFEDLADGTNLAAGAIGGVRFTTTNGFTWRVGDFATGFYNGKYPNGGYTSQGTHWAWLGTSQGAGRIDFVNGPASSFSILASEVTPVSLEAYGAGGNLLESAGPAASNYGTGSMHELKISRVAADIAYVIVHDSGNFFLVDSICTDAPGVGNTEPTVDAGGPYAVDEGSSVTVTASGNDPEGGALTYDWDLDNDGQYDDATGTSAAFDASLLDGPSTHTIGVRVTVEGGLTTTDSATVGVRNVAPTIGALGLTGTTAVACVGGNAAGLSFSISDPGVSDTHSGTIDWGDGSALEAFSGSSFSGGHSYSAGSYTVTVNASDDDGGTDSASSGANAVQLLYATSGFLPPINAGATRSSFKLGSTVPVKLRITDCNGVAVSTLHPNVDLKKIDSVPDTPVNEVISSSSADVGDDMRYVDDHYMYNLSTKNSQFCTGGPPMCSAGDLTQGTYELKVSDPTIAPVIQNIDLRAK